jgi:hypothetical protein
VKVLHSLGWFSFQYFSQSSLYFPTVLRLYSVGTVALGVVKLKLPCFGFDLSSRLGTHKITSGTLISIEFILS